MKPSDEIIAAIREAACCVNAQLAEQLTVDMENTGWICRNDTWQYDILSFNDGVLQSTTPVDSGIACDQPPPIDPTIDHEEYCEPDTNTIWRRTVLYTFADSTKPNEATTTVLSTVDTGVSCSSFVFEPMCLTRDGVKTELFAKIATDDDSPIDSVTPVTYVDLNGNPFPTQTTDTVSVGPCRGDCPTCG